MRRFWMLVGVAAVAGAMYVAAASGSQQSAGPTAKQFKALKAQVATLSKKLKTTQTDLDTVAYAYVHCSLPAEKGIVQKGDSVNGYNFTPPVGSPGFTTAIDVVTPGTGDFDITSFNSADSGCQSLVGAAALRHRAARAIAQSFARTH